MTAAWDDASVSKAMERAASFDRGSVNGRYRESSEWIRANSRREKLRHAWAFFEDGMICPQSDSAFPMIIDHSLSARCWWTTSSNLFSTVDVGGDDCERPFTRGGLQASRAFRDYR